MILFRQVFDPQSSTYSYLLADPDTREAVLIDSVYEQVGRDAALIEELGLRLIATLETHVHADHVTGASLLKSRFASRILLAAAARANGADQGLADGDEIAFGAHRLSVRETPGHTDGCLTYVLDGGVMAFTGDCLLIRGCGRTDFQQGDARKLFRSVRDRIFSLPDDCLIYPAHDYRGLTVSSVAEEKRFNPRLGGEIGESDFIGYMQNLGLPHPKQMDIAVPANMRCGRSDALAVQGEAPDWAPLHLTFAGIWEIEPHWLEEHLGAVTVLDVREASEFNGALGHLPGARLIPLGDLSARLGEVPRDKPIVAVCRAGGRSAQATVLLGKAGIARVANLPGGMLRWRALGLMTEGAGDDLPGAGTR